ncbi:MAG: hypothetical protein DDT35_00898 [Firmicutes bacterium]|nr:hypothetical protein [Bacillota bacterium]
MKKYLVTLVVAVMLITLIGPLAEARDDARMREAILLAKRLFPITDTYQQFFTNQHMTEGKTIYHFEWRGSSSDPAGFNPSQIMLSVDGERMLVTNYSFQEATPRNRTLNFAPLPKFTEEQAQRTAAALAARLAPQEFATMRLFRVTAPTVRIGKRHWPHHYSFHYIQYVNNIPFHGNSLFINVNADSGEVAHYWLNFTPYTFPSPQGIIPLAQAAEVFRGVGLRLVYQRSFSWRNEESKPFLAYVLEDGRRLSIDAFTGRVFTNEHFLSFQDQQSPDGRLAGSVKQEHAFTPQELKEIELVAGLLPLVRVDALAREIAALPVIATLHSSRLYLDPRTEQRIWNLQYTWGTEGEQGSAFVVLDAATGALESFYYGDNDKQEIKPTMTQDEALVLARQFLTRWVGDKYGQVELAKDAPIMPFGEISHFYSFVFNRSVNGIPVVNDNLFITVRHDSRIIQYNANWYRGEFVSPQGVLSGRQMSDRFLADVGLELSYVLTQVEQKGERGPVPQIRLVYQPKELNSYLFDAFKGGNIDWQGKAIVPVVKPNYTDIARHWAYGDIKLLVEWNLLRLPGNEFRPDQDMNLGDLLSLLSTAAGWDDSIGIGPEWIKAIANERNISALNWAAQSNLVREDEKIDPAALVTREMLAFYLARLTGHGETAALEGIWTAPFRDFNQVGTKYQGSVAIVHALRLMIGAQNAMFLPQNHATRAQVAVILARMLR